MRDGKPLTPKAHFADIGLKKKYCLQWNCVGLKCENANCPRSHDSLIQMEKEDRDKILVNLVKTKAAYLNPALARNRRFVTMLSPSQKTLFPPGTILASKENGASEGVVKAFHIKLGL